MSAFFYNLVRLKAINWKHILAKFSQDVGLGNKDECLHRRRYCDFSRI